MISLRWRVSLTRADTSDREEILHAHTHGSYDQFLDRELSLIPSGSYSVAGFSVIKELCVITEDAGINVVITTAAGSFTLPCDGVLILQDVGLTAVAVVNPSSAVPVQVHLIAAGV
jgi:hypothetical protein